MLCVPNTLYLCSPIGRLRAILGAALPVFFATDRDVIKAIEAWKGQGCLVNPHYIAEGYATAGDRQKPGGQAAISAGTE